MALQFIPIQAIIFITVGPRIDLNGLAGPLGGAEVGYRIN